MIIVMLVMTVVMLIGAIAIIKVGIEAARKKKDDRFRP